MPEPPPVCLYVRPEAAAAGGARELFIACWRAPPAEEQDARLQTLLRAKRCGMQDVAAGVMRLPREGTISPWSSKATDIAHCCGLDALARLERGWWHPDKTAEEVVHQTDFMRETLAGGFSERDWRRYIAPPAAGVQEDAIPLGDNPRAALAAENKRRRLALTEGEVAYFADLYAELRRDPTAAELMMIAQANSEHCRHKLFNARWQTADGEDSGCSLMELIRRTHEKNPRGVITAFNDNAAVISAGSGADFAPDEDDVYRVIAPPQGLYIVAKAETHNHPTAVSPYPGAATGSGGEIRDEAAAGRGAAARAGFCGYMVSALDGSAHPPPPHIASARQIITEAPLGAAAYNNEFGRPALAGFFRSYEEQRGARCFGFHKPVMLAGGIGQMLPAAAGKRPLPPGALLLALGGEGFRIGLGGGAASSLAGGGDAALDYASVQRDNAEMQRRAQQVIDTLRRRADNPILSLHDVGAGGLANAVSELAHDAGRGALARLDDVPVKEQGMTAAEIWCNESQERYVLAIMPAALEDFESVCRRERCPFAVIGEITERRDIVAMFHGEQAAALPLEKMLAGAERLRARALPPPPAPPADGGALLTMPDFRAAAFAVLRHPAVACKRFLITIGDRTVGGLTAREQMVGPWQTPVADCAAICHDFDGVSGAAFALGERAPAAAVNPAAAARLAISEAALNLFAADVHAEDIKLSLNWMANCADDERKNELRAAAAAASDFCIALGLGVIVGKDSLSMRMPAAAAMVESPAFAAAFAFAPLADARRVYTPQLSGREDTALMRLAFAPAGAPPALAASAAAAAGVFNPQQRCPDISAPALAAGLRALAACRAEDLILAYHDCSDGGAWAALCEMAFAANCGVEIYAETFAEAAAQTDGGGGDGWEVKAAAALFCEAPAVIIEVTRAQAARVMQIVSDAAADGAPLSLQTVARPLPHHQTVRVYGGGDSLLKESLGALRRAWEETGAAIAAARDNPDCARAEAARDYENDPGLFAALPPSLPPPSPPPAAGGARPRVAILREVGANGQREMAAAFTRAGFDAVDITMQDLRSGRHVLDGRYSGAALCGGFSYGDVLGAGRGWALGALNDARLRDMFSAFFARRDCFVLGVCNGCQALAHLQPLMPAADEWAFPDFLPNESRRFEARLVMAEALPSPSPFFSGLAGLQYPIVVSHAEGRAVFADDENAPRRAQTLMRFIDNSGAPAAAYPYNPNGSAGGATGFCSPDGRITLLMPHPERCSRRLQLGGLPPPAKSAPAAWKEDSPHTPWQLLFDNARRFIG